MSAYQNNEIETLIVIDDVFCWFLGMKVFHD